jgi:hypothetical protein
VHFNALEAVSPASDVGGVLPCLEEDPEGRRLTFVVVILPCLEYKADVSNDAVRKGLSFPTFNPPLDPSEPAGRLSPRDNCGRFPAGGSSKTTIFACDDERLESGLFCSESSSERRFSPSVIGVGGRELGLWDEFP